MHSVLGMNANNLQELILKEYCNLLEDYGCFNECLDLVKFYEAVDRSSEYNELKTRVIVFSGGLPKAMPWDVFNVVGTKRREAVR